MELADQLLELLKKKKTPWTIEGLSNQFDCSVARIREALKVLHDRAVNIVVDDDVVHLSTSIQKKEPTVVQTHLVTGESYKFGYVTDNHLGSKYERLDVLHTLYEVFKEAGVHVVFNTGNMIDGEAPFNKYDLHKRGLEDQVNYFVKRYPRVEGIQTQFITGDDHEGWFTQREGVDVGRFIQERAEKAGRTDLLYLGHMEHDVILKQPKGSAKIRLVHPGGGSAYAISYTTQKLIESYTPGEKPNVLLIGHYHKAEFLHYRGVYAIQGGCTCDQTPFMRKKRLAAHVGGWIVELQQLPNGVIPRLRAEWLPFYDKKYYEKKWKYHF